MNRTLYTDLTVCALDDHRLYPAPRAFNAGLVGFLRALLTFIARPTRPGRRNVTVGYGATVILADDAAAALAVTTPEELADQDDDLTAAGWTTKWRDGWVTCRHDLHPDINLCLVGQVDQARSIVLDSTWPQDWVDTLDLWQDLTGIPWRGTPGATGMSLLRRHLPTYRDADSRPLPITARPKNTGPDRAGEKAWTGRDRWDIPQQQPYSHSYDTVRGYLAAMGTCEHLAPWSLRHTGKIAFDPKRAGWWHVQLAPWQHAHADRLPHPAGPGGTVHRWITTPRAVLLQELTEQGIYAGFEVMDSWTGPAKRILRTYAEQVDRIYRVAVELQNTPDNLYEADARRIATAAKALYREAWGLFNHADNSMYRPDWHHAILATHASNLWRKMWTVGLAEDRWPTRIDVDNLWYDSTNPDPAAAAPRAFTLGIRLGQFQTKGTRTLAEKVAA